MATIMSVTAGRLAHFSVSPQRYADGMFVQVAIGLFIAKTIVDELERSRRSKDVRHGFEREHAAAIYLHQCGAEVEVSPGSRGAADIVARWDDEIWFIQMKSSRNGEPRWPRGEEIERLVRKAQRQDGVPVVGMAQANRTMYYHAQTQDRLYPSRM